MKRIGAFPLLLLSLSAAANDRHGVPRPPRRLHASSQQHDGSSPFPPLPADDTRFVVDTGSDLDTDCTYHSGGPLIIHVPITRYVGPVKGDGTLQDLAELVAHGYLSEKVHLRMPAYDVDMFGDPTDATKPVEVDRVYFNDHEIGELTGDNDIWKLNEFEVPIEWVKFPAMGSDGVQPAPADNIIRIEIDTASGGEDNWCTSVDWVELEFGAIAPIFLVHGFESTGAKAWRPEFSNALTAAKVPFSDEIDLPGAGSFEGNAAVLAARLSQLAAKFGAKKCHIIAHSKGGLDARAYLNGEYDPDTLKVLSLYTISTPHHGSPIADLTILLSYRFLGPKLTELLVKTFPGGAQLSKTSMFFFNLFHGSVPGDIKVYCYGADADANGDHLISADEVRGLAPDGFENMSAYVATLSYNIVGSEAPVKVTLGTQPVRLWGDVSFSFIDIDVSLNFRKNDVLVSTVSATAPFGSYEGTSVANHSTVKSPALASSILRKIVTDYPNR